MHAPFYANQSKLMQGIAKKELSKCVCFYKILILNVSAKSIKINHK